MNNKEYLLRRCGWIIQVSKSIEEKRNRCLVIDKLNAITEQRVTGVVSTSYPASFRVRYKEVEKDVMVWVKESKIDSSTSIPYTLINECKLMGSVIRDMFYKRRSPHFIFPVAQILTNDKNISEDEMVSSIEKSINPQLCYSQEHLAIFNIMEYAPRDSFISLKNMLKDIDLSKEIERMDLVTVTFQILYNLTVMENLKFRHGDLHLDNILVEIIIDPSKAFDAIYVIDEDAETWCAYQVPSMVFSMFIDFDRSIINTDQYKSITIPEEYLQTKPCSVGQERVEQDGRERIKNVANLPFGVVEDCWKTWNPYADLTRFLAHVRIVKPEALEVLFPETTLRNLLTLMGTGKPFGRQSLRELKEEFENQEEFEGRNFLSRCTPREILKQFAAHHPSLIGFIQNKNLIDRERGHVYYV